MSSKIEVNRETLEARLTEIMQNLTFAVDRNTIREAIRNFIIVTQERWARVSAASWRRL